MDSINLVRFSNQVFCSWDYRVQDETFVQYCKSGSLRFFLVIFYFFLAKVIFKKTIKELNSILKIQNQLSDLAYKEKMDNLKFKQKALLLIKRILINFFVISMFGGAGYGFYILNQLSFEVNY